MSVVLSEFHHFEHAHSFPVFGPIGSRPQHLLDLRRSQETLRLITVEAALEPIGPTQALNQRETKGMSAARTTAALLEDLHDFPFAVCVQQAIDFHKDLRFCLARNGD